MLSKYILALLKKDEPLADLRANCTEELNDFLDTETAGFVAKLFRYISEAGGFIESKHSTTLNRRTKPRRDCMSSRTRR